MERSTVTAPRADESGVSTPTPSPNILDEAFARVSGLDFEIPNPFVSHAPMACEALVALDLESMTPAWVERFESSLGTAIAPVAPNWTRDVEWADLIGDHRRLPEWMGYFERAIADDGWPAVVGVWVPRFLPGLASALFHGVIRTSHAVRAIGFVDSPARRAELARALGNWAVWMTPGTPVDDVSGLGDPAQAIVGCAAAGARSYAVVPSIVNLHGVTGAMAVHLLSDHLAPADAAAGAAQIRAEHLALYRATASTYSGGAQITESDGSGWDDGTVVAASESYDPHQVKLVEACRRGYGLTGDPGFARAAETVTHRSS